ncbi:uroporphyrinogen decarboxylase family protein [Bacteroidota bacterium]
MTKREQVLEAFQHKESDSIPAYVRIIENWEAHKEYFGIEERDALFDKLNNTIRSFVPDYLGKQVDREYVPDDNAVTIDIGIWGIPEEYAGTYSDTVERPLSHAETLSDIEKNKWPSGSDWDFKGMNEQLRLEKNLARLSPSWMPVFSRLAELFGMEKALTDLYLNRTLIEAALQQIDNFYTEFYENMLSSCGSNLDIFGLGDDFAGNTGLFIDPDLWRKLFKPLYAKYIGMAKDHGLHTFMHCCGKITEVLPDLIDIGLDGWQTVQTHLPGQDPEYIKKEFGKHLTFIGAIDTTNIINREGPEVVRSHVRSQINILGRDGGYICAPDHIILSDVSSENIEALYDECRMHKFILSE